MLVPPLVSFDSIELDTLNECLVAWEHKMGPLKRPPEYGFWAHGLRHHGMLVGVVSASALIRETCAGFTRAEAVELSRVCAERPDICRVLVRLWREFVFPCLRSREGHFAWAVSYQDAVHHTGNLYRFDGSLAATIERLREVIVEHRDGLDVMRQHDSPATLHYVDPPYLPETRSPANKYDLKHRMYRHELTRKDHISLLAFLKKLTGMVVLSGYPSDLYDSRLKGWRRVETEALADGARKRTEVLWINPAACDALDKAQAPLLARMQAKPAEAVAAGLA